MVFPEGIDGVELIDADAEERPAGLASHRGYCTKWDGTPCFKWEACLDRESANEAYARIIAAMAGEASAEAPQVAISGRFFINPGADHLELADLAALAARESGDPRVFILSDRYRALIAERISSHGVHPIHPKSGELASDLGRDSGAIMDYLMDWKTLIAAKAIFYTKPRISSALYPVMARFGHG